MISLVVLLHTPRSPIQDMEIPIPVDPVPELEITPDPSPQVPRIVVLQTIPKSATIFVELPPRQKDMERLTAEAVGESLHLHYNNFSQNIEFDNAVYVNYSEFKSRTLILDLTLGD